MKDIHLVDLADGRIGLFSHHETDHSCLTSFITVAGLNGIARDVIAAAQPINHTPFLDAWSGVN
jgi:beta-1,2-mannooligosaccharide synthase